MERSEGEYDSGALVMVGFCGGARGGDGGFMGDGEEVDLDFVVERDLGRKKLCMRHLLSCQSVQEPRYQL